MDSHNSCDEYEEEDDIFYHELKRQVLLLTAEEEEELPENKTVDVLGTRKQGNGPCSVFQPGFYFYDWPVITKDSDVVPAWVLGLWRRGSGTGVFIPQIDQSTRKYNSSTRKKKERRITYRPVKTT